MCPSQPSSPMEKRELPEVAESSKSWSKHDSLGDTWPAPPTFWLWTPNTGMCHKNFITYQVKGNCSWESFLFKVVDKEAISSSSAEGSLWVLSCWVNSGQEGSGGKNGEQRLIWKLLSASEVVSCICIYVYGVHIYFLFLSPPPPSQAADFDMCSIVWSWVCHLCLHLLCGLLFEVSLVASSS